MNRVMILFSCFVLLLCATGCPARGKGLQTEYVEGLVTLDGVPLPGATVIFSPTGTTGEMASGTSDAQGIYKLSSSNGDAGKGAVAGEYAVSVKKVEVTNFEEGDPKAPKDPVTGQPLSSSEKLITDPVYQRSATTPLKYTVNPGKNEINLELKSNP